MDYSSAVARSRCCHLDTTKLYEVSNTNEMVDGATVEGGSARNLKIKTPKSCGFGHS